LKLWIAEDAETDFNAELAELAEVVREMLCELRALGVEIVSAISGRLDALRSQSTRRRISTPSSRRLSGNALRASRAWR
jgi:hypothetical protein